MSKLKMKKPLADRMRPNSLADFLGQEDLLGKNKLLQQAILQDQIPSMILWGPPGSGKTTLANIIAKNTKAEFCRLSAVSNGKKDLLLILKKAEDNLLVNKKTLLFIDEIHRWTKSQQDALLPAVEKGDLILIGATTENPSFEVISALLSRCRVFVLQRHEPEQLLLLLDRAVKDKENGLGDKNIKIDKKTKQLIAELSNGDARVALNVLEYAASINQVIEEKTVKESFQKSSLFYDKNGEEHYNIISALHKSMRGSDADASLYWLSRMLEAGEDLLYIARRIVRFASEDIGLANSKALEQAVAAYQACHFIGRPEANVILAQVVVYMAKCPKSNELYSAYKQAANDVFQFGALPVPLHLRNSPTKLMKELGYGKDYKYSPDFNYSEQQEYFPEKLKKRKYLKN